MEGHSRVHPDQAGRPVDVPAVGLADLVDAARLLGLSREELHDAARMLGLRRVAAARAELERPAARPPEPAPRGATSAPTAPSVETPVEILEDVRPLPVAVIETPAQPASTPMAPRPLSDLLPEGRGPAPPVEGLFAGPTRRALLRGITAVRAREGELDVEAAVDLLAANETLGEIPLEWIETTHGEVQLLLDVGASMDPYREDVERLPDELIRILGDDELELRWFEDCPLGPVGVLSPDQLQPAPYSLPPAHTRLVAVTAFGARGDLPAPWDIVTAWRRLAALCRRSGVPLLVLTPLPPERRPGGLAAVTWDHGTGVREVVRAVRLARVA